MKKTIAPLFQKDITELDDFISDFNFSGKQFGEDSRNTIKLFDLNGTMVNIKAFKTPIIINRLIYGSIRKSKAQRSFEFANRLFSLGIKSPTPIAYYEFSNFGFFGKSYYISKHLNCDLTFRELTKDLNYPDHEIILRAFTRFTYDLHQKGVNFLDHSPGNTLIQITPEGYKFFLVDLNRMRFRKLSFEDRIKNFARLSKHQEMIELMSDEYSKLSGESYEKVVNLKKQEVAIFRRKIENKSKIKRLLSLRKIS